jgi:hypothetical protein
MYRECIKETVFSIRTTEQRRAFTFSLHLYVLLLYTVYNQTPVEAGPGGSAASSFTPGSHLPFRWLELLQIATLAVKGAPVGACIGLFQAKLFS